METGLQNLRKQLALAVRSIQWSYSIFWSTSPSELGVLEWGEGYYNGDIKTRKTIQAGEFNVDQMGLQRSEQLRELYESLLAGDSNPQARRPSAALSPEDLSNTEWYYLVCMSFVFNLGQGLPGRTLETGQPIWICNAHQADSSVFGRSLLAKSASIQTVVCFPFLGGVVELGVTDMVLEDLPMVQYVQASLLEIDCPAVFSYTRTSVVPCEEIRSLESPDDSSSGFGLIQPVDETKFKVECASGELIDDDDLSNCVYTSMTESECISQNLINPENPISLLNAQEQDIQDEFSDDLHYRNILTSLFKSTNELILEPSACNRENKSSFVNWRKGGIEGSCLKHTNGSSQRVLKKILSEVPRMHDGFSNHAIAERRSRESVNDRISALKSLIPSIDKVDKASILDDTINYLKNLKRRVEDLETSECSERKTHKKSQDMAERTSDNYGNNKAGVKRKANESDEGIRQNSKNSTKLSISLIEKDVLIELRCPWKECILLEIIDSLSSLRLDTHSVESSTTNNFLSVTIKAKIERLSSLSAGMIKQVLQRVLMKA